MKKRIILVDWTDIVNLHNKGILEREGCCNNCVFNSKCQGEMKCGSGAYIEISCDIVIEYEKEVPVTTVHKETVRESL